MDTYQYNLICTSIRNLHNADPEKVVIDSDTIASELLYSNRMLQILEIYEPGADLSLKVAVQCQHLKRWEVERNLFPLDRKGYHQWRREVMGHQLKMTENLLVTCKVAPGEIESIISMLKNQGNKSIPEAQTIQDVACIVFLKWYFEPFAKKHDEGKVVDILKKTTRKMSEKAFEVLKGIDLSSYTLEFVKKASVL